MRTKAGRTKITIEAPLIYRTTVKVRVTDLNYANHLANDKILSLIHEARVRFLASLNYDETNVEGKATIMSDAEIQYKNQSYLGDEIEIGVTIGQWHRKGVNIMYRLWNKSRDNLTALAKTGFVFFDYESQKPVPVPEKFKEIIEKMLDKAAV
jgi:acyl-CoA thioesterase FadM